MKFLLKGILAAVCLVAPMMASRPLHPPLPPRLPHPPPPRRSVHSIAHRPIKHLRRQLRTVRRMKAKVRLLLRQGSSHSVFHRLNVKRVVRLARRILKNRFKRKVKRHLLVVAKKVLKRWYKRYHKRRPFKVNKATKKFAKKILGKRHRRKMSHRRMPRKWRLRARVLTNMAYYKLKNHKRKLLFIRIRAELRRALNKKNGKLLRITYKRRYINRLANRARRIVRRIMRIHIRTTLTRITNRLIRQKVVRPKSISMKSNSSVWNRLKAKARRVAKKVMKDRKKGRERHLRRVIKRVVHRLIYKRKLRSKAKLNKRGIRHRVALLAKARRPKRLLTSKLTGKLRRRLRRLLRRERNLKRSIKIILKNRRKLYNKVARTVVHKFKFEQRRRNQNKLTHAVYMYMTNKIVMGHL